MRVVHIVTSLSYGGVEMACIHLCNYQVRFCDVYLISLCDRTETNYSFDRLDTRIKLLTMGKHPGFNGKLFFRLYHTLRLIMPSIVHTHAVGLFYATSYILVNRKSEVFHTVHSPAKKDAPGLYHYFYLVLLKVGSIQMVGNSRAVANSMKKFYGKSCAKHIYLGISKPIKSCKHLQVQREVNGYRHSKYTRIFIHIGRIAIEKNQLLLYTSLRWMLTYGSDIILLVIGEIQSQGVFSQLKKLSHPDIHYLGYKENVADYIAMSDAFCLTSRYEGLSLATIEAMSMKVIPICTPACGLLEVVKDGYNGFLSEDHTVEGYVKAIKRYFALNDQNRETMRENAFRTYIDSFTIEQCGKQYLNLYESVLSKYQDAITVRT